MGEKDAKINDDDDDEKKSYAMVCAANMNRSMAAHCALLEKGVLNVSSFGAGSSVKIPGSTRDDPNVYTFGKASYADVRKDLIRLDERRGQDGSHSSRVCE